MPWPNYDAFWEDKTKKKIQPRQVWVNIEFQTSVPQKDSLHSFLDLAHPDQQGLSPVNQTKFQLTHEHEADCSNITPLRRHGMVKPKLEANSFTQLQVPLLPIKANYNHNNSNHTRDNIMLGYNHQSTAWVVSPSRSTTSKRRLSMGSESDVEDESSLVDDDSLASLQNQQQEIYEQMNLSISPLGGFLSFDRVKQNEPPPLTTTQVTSLNNDDKAKQSVREDNPINRTLAEQKGPSSSFELTSTHVQSQKDQMDKLKLEIRRVCLKVAAESYKKANVHVPDFLLAQLNNTSRNRVIPQWNPIVDNNKIVPRPLNQVQEKEEEVIIKTPEINQPIEIKIYQQNELTTPNHTKILLKLSKDDEIHALPCQCALNLIGIPGFGTLTPQNFDVDESEFGRRFFSSSSTIMDESQAQQQQPLQQQPLQQQSSTQTLSLIHDERYKEIQNSDFKTTLNEDESKRRKREEVEKCHDLYNTFMDSWDYHEIVLVRRRVKMKNIQEEGDDGDRDEHGVKCSNWTTVTIRCKDHDEMDTLIRDLKTSVRDAIVIPFSPNPKSRLQKRKNLSSKRSKRKSKHAILQSPSDSSIISSPPLDTVEYEKTHTHHKESSDSVAIPITPVKSGKEKTNAWNLNFNNYYYCELCHLNFTLLTRRHHCRACERSCCGDCSSVLVVSGGDERRYCNRCSTEILRRQSQALQRQAGLSRRMTLQPELPGKVHPSCSRLGVSVMGKLPHWKYYLHPDSSRRPAVGRLSVEIVEARALPTYDMLKGKVDPYVRATITGYDRDMRWTLREWTLSNRFSLCSSVCSGTLSPQWRGPGRKGGELLTLPVICTAGAILRLEVLHYNEWTHSRGKDILLGFVEIPLSDLSNSNLRREYEVLETTNGRKKKIYHDGYCDNWYRLLSTDEAGSQNVILSKPITDLSSVNKAPEDGRKRPADHTKESLKEVWKRTVGFFITPVEWFASTIKLDLPARKPEAVCEQHKSNAILHIRIKLNASEFGDLASHVWFPPVQKYPPIPPFDPQILWSRIVRVLNLTEPYREAFRFLEEVIKWKREPLVCIETYAIFVVHLAMIQHLLPLLHIYLFLFILRRLRHAQKQASSSLENTVQANPSIEDDMDMQIERQSTTVHESLGHEEGENFPISPSVDRLREKIHQDDQNHISRNGIFTGHDDDVEEEAAKLNVAVNWVAKRFLDNKGLEVMQFQLGCLALDVKNVNMVWHGSKPTWSITALVTISISFILHFHLNRRLLWITGFSLWYFSQSPLTILLARMMLGFWRGIAKVTRRREIYDAEVLELVRKAQ